MQWQNIVRRDPYLAGYVAAKCYEWWQEEALSATNTAMLCGLSVGEYAFVQFVKGWTECLKDVEIDRLQALRKEQEQAEENYTKGDPEVW